VQGSGSRQKSHRPVQVLTKANEIITVLAAGDPMGASEIAEQIGEPRSSVYRLLRTLRDQRYVESHSRGKFELGIRVFALGASVGGRFSVREAARRPMQALHDETEGTVLLYVPRGTDVAACVARLDGRWVRLELVDVGETLALHAGASPRLLLAYAEPEFIDSYLENARLEATTERSPTTPREVRALLAEIRTSGYAISDEDLVPGVASIAAPIRDDQGRVVAAISYSDLAATMLAPQERERSIDLVLGATRETSRRLGWDGAVETPVEGDS
jgi:DNA-binding IclR family transcriptional regulator